jgi:S1-C subfamily serine protease
VGCGMSRSKTSVHCVPPEESAGRLPAADVHDAGRLHCGGGESSQRVAGAESGGTAAEVEREGLKVLEGLGHGCDLCASGVPLGEPHILCKRLQWLSSFFGVAFCHLLNHLHTNPENLLPLVWPPFNEVTYAARDSTLLFRAIAMVKKLSEGDIGTARRLEQSVCTPALILLRSRRPHMSRKIRLCALLSFFGLFGLVHGQVNGTRAPSVMFDSVVTVWSEFGHGTGFIVDKKGLILTSQRVVGPSEIITVQFDPQHKVAATLLAADNEKDIAVLWANLVLCPNCVAAPIATADGKPALVAAGDKIVAVSSPMGPLKDTASGVVSGLDAESIASDIETNPWIAGGPVFNAQGTVIGVTSAARQTKPGRGRSDIVPIGKAAALLDQARTKLTTSMAPAARLLPVESADVFPQDALEKVMEEKKFDFRSYFFDAGDYRVTLVTPIFIYRLRTEIKNEDEKRQAKHKGRTIEATPDVTEIWGLKNWAPYLTEYTPVIEIMATSHMRETKKSILGRALVGGVYSEPWQMKFKTDFYKMKLKCGEKEIQPIQTGKVEEVVDNSHRFTKVVNSSSVGFYSYPADAISPSCGQVTLELHSLKDPEKATTKVLEEKTVERIWVDFEPYRNAIGTTPKMQ